MRKLIETIVRRLSDRPEDTRVTESFEGRTVVYEVSVPEGERGRLIGRSKQSACARKVEHALNICRMCT